MPDSRSASPSPFDRLGPLTPIGREAGSIREWQNVVRDASPKPVTPVAPSLIPLPELGAASATRRRAAATHLGLGARLLEARKPGEAVAAFRQAILLDPDNQAAHHDLGLACLRSGRIDEAIAAFRQAIALKEQFPSAHHNLGLALEERGDDIAAIASHRRAVDLAPSLAAAHMRLGNLYEGTACPDEAVASFGRAAAAKPGSTLGRLARAEALRIQGRLAEAEEWYRRAVASDPKSGLALRVFGRFLANVGRLEEAEACFARALARDPEDASAFFYLAHTRKLLASDRPLLARMASQLHARDLGTTRAELLHFALGKAYDDLGDCEAAMHHFDAANALAATALRFDRPALTARIDRVIAQFREQGSPTRSVADAEGPTPILIVGMPRSGTSLVEQIVSSHPKAGGGGELGFWEQRGILWEAALADGTSPQSPEVQAKEYRALLAGLSRHTPYVTDKTPTNFLWLGLVRAAFPGAFIIHCRRHPVDTCISIYSKRFFGRIAPRDRGSLVFFYRQYQRLTAHWRETLPPERFLEVDYESLVTDREAETRRLIAFLGLDWNDACLVPERNQRHVNTASIWQVRQPVYASAIGRWRRYEPWLGELRDLLDPPAELSARPKSR